MKSSEAEVHSMQRWQLISDESGHTYACPVERADETWKVFQAIEEYWAPGSDYSTSCPDEPDYVIRIDGTFTFTDPKVG